MSRLPGLFKGRILLLVILSLLFTTLQAQEKVRVQRQTGNGEVQFFISNQSDPLSHPRGCCPDFEGRAKVYG